MDALAGYGSSSSDDDNVEVDERDGDGAVGTLVQPQPEVERSEASATAVAAAAAAADTVLNDDGGHFSDDDDPDLSNHPSLFSSLPPTATFSSGSSSSNRLEDVDEDLTTIPAKKVYNSGQPPEEIRPRPQQEAPRKKPRAGPVRIMAPALNLPDPDDDFRAGPSVPRQPQAKRASGLLGLLPAPKNHPAAVRPSTGASTRASPSLSSGKLMVPRSVASGKKPMHSSSTATLNDPGDEDDDGEDDIPFFTLSATSPEEGRLRPGPSGMAPATRVRSDPDAVSPMDRPLFPEGRRHHDYQELPSSQPVASTSEASPGFAAPWEAKRKRGGEDAVDMIEVNGDDLTARPEEWMVRALSEEDATGPRCNVKGQTKRKHQITYLAALAKQNEHELKKQWASNAQSRRATQSKYGF